MDAVEGDKLGRSAEVLLGGLGVRGRGRVGVGVGVGVRVGVRVGAEHDLDSLEGIEQLHWLPPQLLSQLARVEDALEAMAILTAHIGEVRYRLLGRDVGVAEQPS